MVRQRVRIRFCKQGDLRLISHRDLVRAFERLFRRAGLPLSMSEGFHPKPRMSFPLALALGIAGEDEVMEFELAAPADSPTLLAALQPHLPQGMVINSLHVLPQGSAKAAVRQVSFELPVPEHCLEALAGRIAWLWDQPSFTVQRALGRGPVDVRAALESLCLESNRLRFQLRVSRDGTVRPGEVLEALEVADLQTSGYPLRRTSVEIDA